MNTPPEQFIRVSHGHLRDFVSQAAMAVGLPQDKADLLGDLLSRNDLRGVFSHGTQQIATYARLMRDGSLNNKPEISVVQETPGSVLVDGDGGLGYFASHDATLRMIDKAKQTGIAAMATRNHGHFGAAGIYARMPLEHDMLTYVTSGHLLRLNPGGDISNAAGGSPMAFSAPADKESSLVLDFGAKMDLSRRDPHREAITAMAPGLVLRCIGMGEICQSWGGLLCGLPINAAETPWDWPGANQGSMAITFRIDLFIDPAQFKAQMDEYVRAVKELTPLASFQSSYMAGGVEAEREAQGLTEGVQVGTTHRELLEELGQEIGVDVPW